MQKEREDEQSLESVFTLKIVSGAKTSDLRCSFIFFQNLTEIREDKLPGAGILHIE